MKIYIKNNWAKVLIFKNVIGFFKNSNFLKLLEIFIQIGIKKIFLMMQFYLNIEMQRVLTIFKKKIKWQKSYPPFKINARQSHKKTYFLIIKEISLFEIQKHVFSNNLSQFDNLHD